MRMKRSTIILSSIIVLLSVLPPVSCSSADIAIFDKIENDKVYFIDSTLKGTDGDGEPDINGVTARNYEKNDNKIKAYGKMRLAY